MRVPAAAVESGVINCMLRFLANGSSVFEASQAQRISETYLTGMARLAFLSPKITTAILDGRQPVHLTAARLSRLTDLPLDWSEQRKVLGLD